MKTMRFFLMAGVVMLTILSCQKNEPEPGDPDLLTNQEVLAEALMLEVDLIAEEAVDNSLGLLKSAGVGGRYTGESCPVITYDKIRFPRVITLDFGVGCLGRDGKTRSGKIIISSSAFENLKATREKTFENFVVENRKIEGTIVKTVTINRENLSRTAEIAEEVTITFEDGATFVRKGNLTREHRLGNILDRSDDQVLTWGEVSTSRPNGTTVGKQIPEENPLVFLASCRQIVSGTATFTSGGKTWSIDYGKGDCDGEAELTRDGITRTIKLHR